MSDDPDLLDDLLDIAVENGSLTPEDADAISDYADALLDEVDDGPDS